MDKARSHLQLLGPDMCPQDMENTLRSDYLDKFPEDNSCMSNLSEFALALCIFFRAKYAILLEFPSEI
jgi:hypothetical protein